MMGFGLLLPILFFVALAYVLGWLPQGRRQEPMDRSDRRAGGDRSLEILKERYARGEISKEEYEEMHQELMR